VTATLTERERERVTEREKEKREGMRGESGGERGLEGESEK